jgi:hypothetical protein
MKARRSIVETVKLCSIYFASPSWNVPFYSFLSVKVFGSPLSVCTQSLPGSFHQPLLRLRSGRIPAGAPPGLWPGYGVSGT